MPDANPTRFTDDKTISRFWAKVQMGDSCWLWTASKRSKGYGAFCWHEQGQLVQGRAHVFSFRLLYGAIPLGLCVLHKCDNPACVNPDHLFLGTKSDNNEDMRRKGRHVPGGTHCGANGNWKRGEAHHAAKLDAAKVQEIRALYASGSWSYSKLAARFSVGVSAIHKVVNGSRWSHIENGGGK